MRLTPEAVEAAITDEQYYRAPGTTMTVCCLTLSVKGGVAGGNGGTASVIGYGDCIDPADFDAAKGRAAARRRAVDEAFGVLAVHLKLGGSV